MQLGTRERPALLRVRSDARAQEVAALCREKGVRFLVEVDPDRPEDVAELDRALAQAAPAPARAAAKVGRNDPCPCGSGKKFKRCCLER